MSWGNNDKRKCDVLYIVGEDQEGRRLGKGWEVVNKSSDVDFGLNSISDDCLFEREEIVLWWDPPSKYYHQY